MSQPNHAADKKVENKAVVGEVERDDVCFSDNAEVISKVSNGHIDVLGIQRDDQTEEREDQDERGFGYEQIAAFIFFCIWVHRSWSSRATLVDNQQTAIQRMRYVDFLFAVILFSHSSSNDKRTNAANLAILPHTAFESV